MAQKIYIQLFIGFMLLLTLILLVISLFLGQNSASPPPNSDSEFPIIYIALMVLAGLAILLGAVIRMWR